MIPYSRPKRSDLYTLSQSKLLENLTLHSGTYLYSPYMAVPPGVFPLRETELRSKQKTMGQGVRGEANGDSTPKES